DRMVELKNLNQASTASIVADQRAWGIRTTVKGQRDVDLYIAAESKLLLKIERLIPDPNAKAAPAKLVKLEEFLGDYKEVSGALRPLHRVSFVDGQKHMDMILTELKLSEQVDENEFARP